MITEMFNFHLGLIEIMPMMMSVIGIVGVGFIVLRKRI